jgi:hypothetical protein
MSSVALIVILAVVIVPIVGIIALTLVSWGDGLWTQPVY